MKAADAIRELADLLLMKGRQSAGYVLCILATMIADHVSHAAFCAHHTLFLISRLNRSFRCILSKSYRTLHPIRDLMAILPYPVAPPKNPQQKANEQKVR